MKKKFGRNLKFQFQFFLSTVRQIRFIVWVSLFIAIAGVINYESELIPLILDTKFTRSVNSIIYQVLLTYITGCVFYFLVEFLYRSKKKISVYVSITNNVFLITERTEYLLNEIGKTYNKSGGDICLNSETLSKCCSSINIDAQKVNVWFYPECTFRQYVIKTCEEIKAATIEILSFSELFNEKWAYSVSKISGLSDSIVKGLDIRFAKPTIQSYYVWGLFAETVRLRELGRKYDNDYYRLSRMKSEAFHPVGLEYRVDQKK